MPKICDLPLTRLIANCKEDENGCLVWQGAVNPNGYGSITLIDKQPWRTHRLAYYLTYGDIPEGLIIGHKCDVRTCCNPEHLEAITHNENMRQMVERGRAKKGGKSMTPVDTRKEIANSPKTIAVLAKEYNLDVRTVERYRKRYRIPAI
jgi:hypothetical protein